MKKSNIMPHFFLILDWNNSYFYISTNFSSKFGLFFLEIWILGGANSGEIFKTDSQFKIMVSQSRIFLLWNSDMSSLRLFHSSTGTSWTDHFDIRCQLSQLKVYLVAVKLFSHWLKLFQRALALNFQTHQTNWDI